MSETVGILARFHTKAGAKEDLLTLLLWMAHNTRQESGCEAYDLFGVQDESDTFYLVERYVSDDALAVHRNAEYYRVYRSKIFALIEDEIDVTKLIPIDVRKG